MRADAAETQLCTYLSAVVLLGLAANAALGWWWMDPIAGWSSLRWRSAKVAKHGRAVTSANARQDPRAGNGQPVRWGVVLLLAAGLQLASRHDERVPPNYFLVTRSKWRHVNMSPESLTAVIGVQHQQAATLAAREPASGPSNRMNSDHILLWSRNRIGRSIQRLPYATFGTRAGTL
jgi:hypothetical protein